MERIRVNSPGDGDVITALARLYHRVEASRPLYIPSHRIRAAVEWIGKIAIFKLGGGARSVHRRKLRLNINMK